MRGIVTWFVKNSVPANLFMFFLIFGGFFVSYPTMKSEFFPIPDLLIQHLFTLSSIIIKSKESSISSKNASTFQTFLILKK